MLRSKLTILFLVLQLYGLAQEEFVRPSRFITRFPYIQFTGGIIVLQARFDTYPDTLNFILDTGSGGISLDSTTAAYFKLTPEPSDRMIRGIAGMKNVSFLNKRKLHLPGLTIDSLNFHVNDYALLTAVYGERIDGIIGYSVFSRYIVKVNFDSSYLEFWTKGVMRYPKGGYLLRPTISTIPVQMARIKDDRTINSRFLYDMGAGLNMMLSTEFLKDSNLLHKKRKMFAKEAEGLGGKIDLNITVIKEVKLGPYRFRNVPVFVFDDTYNVTSYPYLAGLIGNDLLRRFNIILNYERRDIHLVPNSHFNDPFDYSYSGIELYLIDEKITIGDVARGSPAEKAGIKEGDILISVNNKFATSIDQMKTALQTPGKPVRVILQRGSNLIQKEFKVKSILH